MIEYLLCLSIGFAAGFSVAWSLCALAWKRVQMNLIQEKRIHNEKLSADIDRLIQIEFEKQRREKEESRESKHI